MKAKKSLGQNFLKNKSVVKDIIFASELTSEDIVLEIGPGKGILTEELLGVSKKIYAIEKDDLLYEFLQRKFINEIESEKLNLIHGDILEAKLDLPKNYKLVANIPYNITGEIIRKFLTSQNQPQTITLLVQHEVAERIVAKDGKESILSISVKAYGEPKIIKKVKKENFLPQPKVDSAILSIKNISKNFFKDISEKSFFQIVKMGFSQKRKMLKNTLKPLIGVESEKVFQKTEIDQNLRAERLKLDDWKKLLS